jgi:ABC-type spermidine/putrescine transport system permease subunit II
MLGESVRIDSSGVLRYQNLFQETEYMAAILISVNVAVMKNLLAIIEESIYG